MAKKSYFSEANGSVQVLAQIFRQAFKTQSQVQNIRLEAEDVVLRLFCRLKWVILVIWTGLESGREP